MLQISDCLVSYFNKVKKTACRRLSFLEKVFLLMGCSKNYIMYWGVFTIIIVHRSAQKVCTNLTKFEIIFPCRLYISLFRTFGFLLKQLPQIPADFFFLQSSFAHLPAHIRAWRSRLWPCLTALHYFLDFLVNGRRHILAEILWHGPSPGR